MPISRHHPLLVAALAVLTAWTALGIAHRPHPTSTEANAATVALDASHAEQSPHLETSEITHLAPCSLCLLQRQAGELAAEPSSTERLPRLGGPPTVCRQPHTRPAPARGARAPPLA